VPERPAGPRARYASDLKKPGFAADPAQAHVVDALQKIHDELLAQPPKRRLGKLRWPAIKGLYVWGSVGRGKTWLMDAFYEALPFTRKARTHFHRFMLEVHERRKQHAHEQDPIGKVAADIAARTRVLCFDEFFVSDIADAMILGRLTEALFAHGVTLVATSNVRPDDLYRDGLQRDRFLPAIARLKEHCAVLHLEGATDYRLRALTLAQIYLHPGDAKAEKELARWFASLAPEGGKENTSLTIEGRKLKARRAADGVAWFDFAELCQTARSAADYVELARTHHSVLVGHIPRLGPDDEDAARRFVNMVDEFYDRGVKLVLAADAAPDKLYAGKRVAFEFARTVSRLKEMQSREYLAKPHLP